MDDAEVITSAPPAKTTALFDMLNMSESNSTITDVLARPVIVWQGPVTSTTTFSQAYVLPDFWMNSSRNVREKLSQFQYLKGTMVVRFVVNATPFMSGKYWMFYAPYAGASGRPVLSSLAHQTAYPGVELDIASSKSAELRIPFVAPVSHIDLTNKIGQFGDLYISEISPISSGNSATTANAIVYMWMEDAELFMPTACKNLYLTTPTAQIKSEAKSAASAGVVTGIASKIGGLADSLGSLVPGASAITAPVSWASRLISGVASAFGYSKPTSISTNDPVHMLPGKGYTHGEDVDNSVSLSLSSENAIEGLTGEFGADVDEMQICSAAGRPCIFETALWETSDPVNTTLETIRVHPFGKTEAELANSVNPTLLQFVASMFAYWRGTIRYRVACTKTAFHSGRIAIVYSPFGYAQAADAGDTLRSQCYKMVLDLSESSEITFDVPYVSPMLWKRCSPYDKDINYFNGYIDLIVLTPLVAASDSVAQEVPIQIWHSAGPDFRLAVPHRTLRTSWVESPAFTTVPRAQIMNSTASVNLTIPTESSVPSIIPSANYTSSIDCEKASIGEAVLSLRTVIKRFSPLISIFLPGGKDGGDFGFPISKTLRSIALDPASFICDPYDIVTTEMALTCDPETGTLTDLVDAAVAERSIPYENYISSIFRFWRGSRRYKYIIDQPFYSARVTGNPQFPTLFAGLANDVVGAVPFSPALQEATPDENFSTFAKFKTTHAQVTSENGVIEISVPYYSVYPISVIAETTSTQAYGNLSSRFPVTLAAMRPANPTMTTNPKGDKMPFFLNLSHFPPGELLSACGDDFSFGFLAGAPTIY